MKKLSKRTRAGLALMAGGMLILGAWSFGLFVLVDRPVSMPVSLAIGEVKTRKFRIYVNKYYSINIEAEKRLPLEALDCMLGISTGPLDSTNCQKGIEPLLQANWTLLHDGRIVDYGSSEKHKSQGGWGNKTVERNIGIFRAEPGGNYVLEVNFTRDGTPLAVTDPHLVITNSQVWPTEEENTEITIFSALFVFIEVIGLALVISSAAK